VLLQPDGERSIIMASGATSKIDHAVSEGASERVSARSSLLTYISENGYVGAHEG
jgi:hypothetical protein